MSDYQKNDDIYERSISTSTLYHQARPKQLKTNTQIINSVDIHQRQINEEIDKMKLTLNLKMEYITKRVQQVSEDGERMLGEIGECDRSIVEKSRQVNNNDCSRQWSIQMQKTIQGIMCNNKQMNKKNLLSNFQQIHTIQERIDELENKLHEEKKYREKQWEELIDNIGGTIIQAENIIQDERQNMEGCMFGLEKRVLDLEDMIEIELEKQKKDRQKEHQYLTNLVQKIMNKLIL